MSRTNKKGFSLAELLISLLIISIVLAAAIPTITKRSGASREQIWRWTTSNNDIFFGVGKLQSTILGLSAMPSNVTYFYSDYTSGDETMESNSDKLAIAQQYDSSEQFFKKSHIAFYTAQKTADATATDGIQYTGRLALDRKNIALGIGTLQALQNDKSWNTAIGHYALFHNSTGDKNTALGFLALPANISGSSNTALGYNSLTMDQTGDSNTAIGASALSKINKISNDSPSNNNVAIGANACVGIKSGSNNICIGTNSGNDPNGGIGKVVPTEERTNINDRIFIGGNIANNANNADLITGYTYYKANTYDKELNVNARRFNVKTFDGKRTLFGFNTTTGTDASGIKAENYQSGATTYSGNTYFDLYVDTSKTDPTQLSISGTATQVNLNTLLADTTSNKGKISINNNALTYRFNNSASPTGGTRVYMDTEYELDISSAKSPISLSAPSISASAAKIRLQAQNNTDPAKIEAPHGLNVTSDKKIEVIAYSELQLGSNNKMEVYSNDFMNLYSKKDMNLKTAKGQHVNIGDKVIVESETGIITGVKNLKAEDVEIPTIGSVKKAIKELYDRTSGGTTSDIRLKDVSGDNTAGLKEINALKVKNYTYKNDKEKTPHVGVIAQDLQKIFPNSVFAAQDGYLKIKTEEIFYAMVNSIKELCAQIQDLTAKITGLDKRITELEKQNQLLKKQNADFEKRLTKLEKQKK